MNPVSKNLITQMERDNAERERRHLKAHGSQVAELLSQYSMLWRPSTSPGERRRISADIWEAGGSYRDPMTDALSPAALVEHIETTVFTILRGYTLRAFGAPLLHGPHVAFSWEYLDPKGLPAQFVGSYGTDFVTISPAGKLQQIVGFFGALLRGRE